MAVSGIVCRRSNGWGMSTSPPCRWISAMVSELMPRLDPLVQEQPDHLALAGLHLLTHDHRDRLPPGRRLQRARDLVVVGDRDRAQPLRDAVVDQRLRVGWRSRGSGGVHVQVDVDQRPLAHGRGGPSTRRVVAARHQPRIDAPRARRPRGPANRALRSSRRARACVAQRGLARSRSAGGAAAACASPGSIANPYSPWPSSSSSGRRDGDRQDAGRQRAPSIPAPAAAPRKPHDHVGPATAPGVGHLVGVRGSAAGAAHGASGAGGVSGRGDRTVARHSGSAGSARSARTTGAAAARSSPALNRSRTVSCGAAPGVRPRHRAGSRGSRRGSSARLARAPPGLAVRASSRPTAALERARRSCVESDPLGRGVEASPRSAPASGAAPRWRRWARAARARGRCRSGRLTQRLVRRPGHGERQRRGAAAAVGENGRTSPTPSTSGSPSERRAATRCRPRIARRPAAPERARPRTARTISTRWPRAGKLARYPRHVLGDRVGDLQANGVTCAIASQLAWHERQFIQPELAFDFAVLVAVAVRGRTWR